METAIWLLVLAVVLPGFELCVLSIKERNTTEFLCNNVNFTEQPKDVVVSTDPLILFKNAGDLGTINEFFFNMFPKAKIMRFENQTMRITAPTKPPRTKHLSLRTLEIIDSKLMDNAYTFALHSLVELENFILHSSVLESRKIDSRFLEANTKLKTIDIKQTKFEFEEGALYTLKNLNILRIVKCDLETIPQVTIF